SANIFFPGTASAERSGRKICDFSAKRARGGRKKYPEQRKAPFFRNLLRFKHGQNTGSTPYIGGEGFRYIQGKAVGFRMYLRIPPIHPILV
ncbi:MAG TPA: hypothetical protein VLS90_12580, partial [Thermodesulfobacteriota bacterium]|nr:hypothetical protein [Thermodesulfobacteriota bacterium]